MLNAKDMLPYLDNEDKIIRMFGALGVNHINLQQTCEQLTQQNLKRSERELIFRKALSYREIEYLIVTQLYDLGYSPYIFIDMIHNDYRPIDVKSLCIDKLVVNK